MGEVGLKLSLAEQEQISRSQKGRHPEQGHTFKSKDPGTTQEGLGRQSAERGDTL